MMWIDREIDFPNADRILCYGEGQVFICELIETKWGNHYSCTECGHGDSNKEPEWTHWMPLPAPPQKEIENYGRDYK